MLSNAQVIILHTIKHGDNGVVIQCYSNTVGRTALYMRLSAKNKVVLSNLHRLNILDVVIYNNGSSMPILKEMAPALKLTSLRTDIFKNTIAIFLSEILVKCVRESESNSRLYNFLYSSISILEHLEEGVANFHIHFMVHLSKMLGFMPTDNYSENALAFNIGRALFVEPLYNYDSRRSVLQQMEDCGCFPLEESGLLHRLLNTRAIEISGIKCSGELRLSFAKHMIKYFSHHLGVNFEVKSLDVLHEVFN